MNTGSVYLFSATAAACLPAVEHVQANNGLTWYNWASLTCRHLQAGIKRIQALADISRSALCWYSNETRAPIASPPNNAQLESTPPTKATILPTYIRVRAVVWECGEGQTHRRPWSIYISPRLRLTQNVSIKTYSSVYVKVQFWVRNTFVFIVSRLLFRMNASCLLT